MDIEREHLLRNSSDEYVTPPSPHFEARMLRTSHASFTPASTSVFNVNSGYNEATGGQDEAAGNQNGIVGGQHEVFVRCQGEIRGNQSFPIRNCNPNLPSLAIPIQPSRPHPSSSQLPEPSPSTSITIPPSPAQGGAPVYEFPLDEQGRKKIVVVGSGNMGKALTLRLAEADYSVIVASRDPDRVRSEVLECKGNVARTEDALGEEGSFGVVVMAVPHPLDDTFPINLLRGKIVIDISNRCVTDSCSQVCCWDCKLPNRRSQAETLQREAAGVSVVKALNVLSAYSLSSGLTGKQVPVCGDSKACRLACAMVRDLGFVPAYRGTLEEARQLEDIPLKFFPAWQGPFWFSVVLFVIFFILTTIEWDVHEQSRHKIETGGKSNGSVYDGIAKGNIARGCAATSTILLAVCYLPGVLAGYIQLFCGTHLRFPDFMDKWLKERKQLGLLMLLNGVLHGLLVIDNPIYEGWRSPTVFCLWSVYIGPGVCAGCVLAASITAFLSWREFRFIQSRLGWFTLVLAILHVIFVGWDGLLPIKANWDKPNVGQLLIVIPLLTVLLKLLLLFLQLLQLAATPAWTGTPKRRN